MANSTSICLNDRLPAPARSLERSLHAPTQLVVIDAGVENSSTLANGVHPSAKVLVLDSDQNGIMQISQVLRSHPAITTLTILAHGIPGCIDLGNTSLSNDTITRYGWELSTWFARAHKPQIHLYSCNLALGNSGIEFIQTLHRLTQASIAASTEFIGHTASGSNWHLNYQLGQIDTQNPIALDILESYPGVLASPIITDAVTTPRSTAEETVISITGLTISDTDGDTQTVTVSVTEGTIALATGSGVTVTGSNATSITFTGTVAQVNAAINGMNYTPSLNYADTTTLSISSNDGTTTASKLVAIAVTPVNDAPTIAPSAATVAEGGNVTFVATNFGIADVDNIAAQIIVKVAALPSKGFLVLDGGKLAVGSSFASDRIPDLQYVHDGTQTTVPGGTSDSFSITVADGAGGIISSTAIAITITPINQLPTVAGSAILFEGEANKPVTLTISDLDQTAATYTIKILSQPVNPAHGTLTFNGTAVTVGQTFSSADLANLKYSHFGNDENFGNPPNVTFNVEVLDDGGGTGVPGAKTATVTLGIKPNNDDPILAINTGITLDTTSAREVVITNTNLNVTDPDSGIPQLAYTLSQAVDPTLGSLQLNGSKIGLGATFTQADINQGRLKYVFNRNTTAGQSFTDSFKFEVRDSSITEFPTVREGGVYSGGALAQNTFTISISTPDAIVDATGSNAPTVVTNTAPVIANNLGIGQPAAGSPTLNEGGSVGITSAMLSVNDPDNSPEQLVYRIEKSPTNGTFKLNGNPVGLYGSFTQKDINDGKVSFQHDSSEDFIDADVTFSVSDGTNLLSNQKLKLDVIPQNDNPVITVGTTVSLAESTEKTLRLQTLASVMSMVLAKKRDKDLPLLIPLPSK
ncbi:MAG: DUF4347 domain-containing protein [Leptolyngbyaceae cyanobacterium CSU_1_4]|nr:DUF4347 domain-containing protein [Leptolyngbyaceae cyanobacterium CSU_1_4]